MKNKDKQPIYDNSYYQCDAIIKTSKYQGLLKQIREKLDKLSLPLPINGFLTSKDYLAWSGELIKKEIVPDDFIKDILIAYGVSPKNEGRLLTRLKFAVFFNIKSMNVVPTISRSVYISDSKDCVVVELNILKTARKKDFDIDNLWKIIKINKKLLWEKECKNKYWVNFDRDLEVYILFQKVKKDIREGIFKDKITLKNYKESCSPYHRIAYYEEFEQIAHRYKGSKFDTIDKLEDEVPSIISHCNRVFGKLKLY